MVQIPHFTPCIQKTYVHGKNYAGSSPIAFGPHSCHLSIGPPPPSPEHNQPLHLMSLLAKPTTSYPQEQMTGSKLRKSPMRHSLPPKLTVNVHIALRFRIIMVLVVCLARSFSRVLKFRTADTASRSTMSTAFGNNLVVRTPLARQDIRREKPQ